MIYTCVYCKRIHGSYESCVGCCAPSKKGASHFDDNKLQLQWLLSMPGLDEVAKVGAYGAKKYGQNNWRGGSEYMRYLGSIVRHSASVCRGQLVDDESGLPHLAHVAYNCLILLTWIKEGEGTNDTPKV